MNVALKNTQSNTNLNNDVPAKQQLYGNLETKKSKNPSKNASNTNNIESSSNKVRNNDFN
jgi:hypothetical protein